MKGGVVFWNGLPNARSTSGVSCAVSKLTVRRRVRAARPGSPRAPRCAAANFFIMSGQKSGMGQRVKTKVTATALPRRSARRSGRPSWSTRATSGIASPGCGSRARGPGVAFGSGVPFFTTTRSSSQ